MTARRTLRCVSIGLIVAVASLALHAREWSDATGTFRVEGELVSVTDGKAKLKLADGRVIDVPVTKLSTADQKFIADSQKPKADKANAEEAAQLVDQAYALLQLDARNNANLIDAKLREATRLNPANIDAEFLRGIYHLLVSSDPDRAAKSFENCLKQQPDNGAVLNNLALSKLKAGSFAPAHNYFERAVKAAPGLSAVSQNLGRALKVHNDGRLPMPERISEELADLYSQVVASEEFPASQPELGWVLVNIFADSSSPSDNSDLPKDITHGGTGFVVNGDFLVTNRHVVGEAKTVKIRVPARKDGKLLEAEVIAVSKTADVAVVKCPGLSMPAAQVVGNVPRRGSDVMVLGFPQFSQLGASIKSTRGAVTSLPAEETENMLLIDAEMNSGNSGGPIANKQGQVVAIATAVFKPRGGTGGRYGAGIPIASQLDFLKTHIPKFAANTDAAAELAWPDVDERVSKSTVLVLVAGGKPKVSDQYAGMFFDPTCPGCSGSGEVKKTLRRPERCPHCRGIGLDRLAVLSLAARRARLEREGEIAQRPPETSDGTIQIISATYGINQSWFDVTAKVRGLAHGKEKWERKVSNADYGDPAPGYHIGNTLVLRYEHNGKIGRAVVYQGRAISIPSGNLQKAPTYHRDKEVASDEKQLHIYSAMYGVNQSFFDVTEKLREKTAGKTTWSATVSNDDWGDPAPGYHVGNTLIVRYTINGKVHLRKEYQGKKIELKAF